MKGHCQRWGAVAVVLSVVIACAEADSAETPTPAADYRFDIRPILAKNCFACHGNDEAHREADLRLDDRQAAVDAGAPARSYRVRRMKAS
jgi:hypothetical protein